MSTCDRAEALRDYAFEELAPGERRAMEQHVAGCAECAGELDRLRVTTAALRALPDREVPRRIAFVSDKVFAPSLAARFFGGFWNSAPKLGFASACAIAGALIFSAVHRPVEIRTVVPASGQPVTVHQDVAHQELTKEIDDAVSKAVARVHAEDLEYTRTVLAAVERKNVEDHRAMVEAFNVLQDRMNTRTLISSADNRQALGAGQ